MMGGRRFVMNFLSVNFSDVDVEGVRVSIVGQGETRQKPSAKC